MSDLGWRADGIDRALAAGGLVLETYRRPGFVGGKSVRVAGSGGSAQGIDYYADPEPEDE